MCYGCRVLLATICNLGLCACIQCLVHKCMYNLLGTVQDMLARKEHTRVMNQEFQDTVKAARKVIYDDGYAVSSERVEELLHDALLVPTEACLLSPVSYFGRRLMSL